MTTTPKPSPSQMMPSLNPDRPSIPSQPSNNNKPQGSGARILSFLLQLLVMSIALSLFFLFAGLAALLLLHLFLAGRALRRHHHHHPSLPSTTNPNNNHNGLSPQQITDLPSFRYYSSHNNNNIVINNDCCCAVCLEGFRDGDTCREIPGCGHWFHKACVDRWFTKSVACPMCRGGVSP